MARAGTMLVAMLAAMLLFPGVRAVRGQEALNLSLAGEQAAHQRRLARELQPYSLKLGDAEVRWGASLAAEWNDNITLLESGAIADTIIRPQANLDLSWPITTANALDFSVTAGYNKYVTHSEFDRFFVLPGSAVAFDVFLRDVRLTFEDLLSYQEDPAERAVVRGTAEFGGLNNLAGVRAQADWNKAKLLLSYHYELFVSSFASFDYLDRSSHEGFARLTLLPEPILRPGLEAGVTPTAYRDSYLRNNVSYSAGGFVEFDATKHISLSARGGAVVYDYEANSSGAPAEELNTFYYGLTVQHQLNKFVSLSLDTGHQNQLGVNQDLEELYYVRPNVGWMVSRHVSASGQFFYENGRETGFSQTEHFERVGAAVSATWRFNRRWSTRLSYRFVTRSSDLPQHGYDNNRVLLELLYAN